VACGTKKEETYGTVRDVIWYAVILGKGRIYLYLWIYPILSSLFLNSEITPSRG